MTDPQLGDAALFRPACSPLAARPAGGTHERTGTGRLRLRTLQCPVEDERQSLDVALREHGVAQAGPAVAHQVRTFEQIRRVAETQGVPDLMKRDPPDIFGAVRISAESRRQVRPDQDIGAAMVAADGVAAKHDPARGRDKVHDDVGGTVVHSTACR